MGERGVGCEGQAGEGKSSWKQRGRGYERGQGRGGVGRVSGSEEGQVVVWK